MPTPGLAQGTSRRALAWIAAIWLAVALFFWPVLFGGKSFCFRDVMSIYYPQATITVEALREGRLPLWEPRIGTGYPFQADPHSMVFYPLTPLLLAFPFPWGFNFFTVIHFALAGTLFFALMRRWKLSHAAAFVGAAVLMFGGYTVTTSCLTTLLRGMTWAVAALLAFDFFLERGGWPALAATALALACQGSGTDPQYVTFSWILLALFPWLRPFPAQPRRALAGLVAAATMGLAILAYQYLPLAQLIANSDRIGGLGAGEFSMFAVDPADSWNFVLPLLFSNIEALEFFKNYVSPVPPLSTDVYWGFPALALAFAGLGWAKRDEDAVAVADTASRGRSSRLWLALAIFTVLLAMGSATPLFPLLMKMAPFLAVFRYPTKYLLLASIAVPAAAALGFEGLMAGRRGCRRLFVFSIVAELVLVSALLGRAWMGSPGSVRNAWVGNLGLALAIAAVLLTTLHLERRGQLGRTAMATVLGLMIVGDVMLATSGSYPMVPDEFLSVPPAAARSIEPSPPGQPPPRMMTRLPHRFERTPGRTMAAYVLLHREAMSGLRGCVYGLNPLLGFMSVRLQGQGLYHGMFDQLPDIDSHDRLAAAAGTRYIVTLYGAVMRSSLAREIGRNGPVVVQELDPAQRLPRAFIAGRAASTEPMPADVAALLALPREARFDGVPPGQVLEPRAVRSCRIVTYEPSAVELAVDLDGSGLLVLSDAWYPGWEIRVDGHPRPQLRVAGFFRGVEVKGGDKKVLMTYRPATFWGGLAISLAVLALMAGASVGPVRRKLDRLLGAAAVS